MSESKPVKAKEVQVRFDNGYTTATGIKMAGRERRMAVGWKEKERKGKRKVVF